MGFFEDIFNNAKKIVNSGKDVLSDQLSSETVYRRDASGQMQQVSTTQKVFGQDSRELPIPVPKLATTLRKNIFAGETPQERLDRIQNERRQTLIPSEAQRAVEEDAASEYMIATGGLTESGGYDPSKVNLVGVPVVGRVKKTIKAAGL